MIANSFISCFIGSLIYLDGDTTCFINFLQSAIIFFFYFTDIETSFIICSIILSTPEAKIKDAK